MITPTVTLNMTDAERKMVIKFRDYHETNPHIYRAFVHYAREYFRATNAQKVGAQLLTERIRWNQHITAQSDTFKIANEHVAFYARMLMHNIPYLDGRIGTRASVADKARWV